jgi:hypothetical protein
VADLERELEGLKRLHQILERTESERELAQQYAKAIEDLDRLKADHQKRGAETQRYFTQVWEMQGEIATLRYGNFELAQENQRLKMNLAGEQGHGRSLEQKIRVLEKQIATMRQDLSVARED